MKKQFYELFGWLGVICVLAGYFFVTIGQISGNSATYHLMMLVGSIFVAVISVKKHNLQPAVLNILFAVFASVALIRLQI